MDDAITRWINGPAGSIPPLDMVMIFITKYGVPMLILGVILQWWSRTDRIHVRHAAICAGISFLVGLMFNQLLLLLVHRARPYDAGVTHLIIERSADPSFPSDHATAAFAVAASFAMQRLPRRTLLPAAAALVIVWSRVYVGTHYLTDVIGGACTGIVAAVVVRMTYREGSRLDQFVTAIF